MAGSLVSVLADHVISVLIEKIFEEISLAYRHREDLELICDELESIKCLLNDTVGAWKMNSSSVRNWLQKLEDFLYDTLHLLEDSSQAQHHTTCISRYLLCRKIRVLKERIRCIHRSSKYLKYLRAIDVKPRPGLVSGELIRNRRKSSGLLLEATTVGMQNDIDLISGWLLTDGPQIITVAGMGGLGKTLLLQHVFNSQKIRESFDHLIWVAVSQSYVAHQLLLHIGRQTKLPDDEKQSHLNAEEVRDNIRRHLQGSRCLLVLDDVWDKHALGDIGFPLEGGSKAMLSTRDRKVLENVGAHRIHHMDYLSEENSWRLFCIHAFPEDSNHSPPEELEKVARAIERKCSRLPLAVKTVAASMASVNRLPNEWESTLNRLNKISTIKEDILPILKLSYDALPDYLKPCFLFCSAYPEDTIMSCEYLVQVWIAQGFVNPDEREDSYELGFSYLNELVDRCMIEFVPYDGNDYIIKYCKMHDLLHELALSESQIQTRCLFQAGKNVEKFPVEKCHSLRRISLSKNKITSIDKTIRSPRLLTLLLWKNLHLKSICEDFFKKMRHLSVLDLSQTSIKSLPKSIAKLKHLRFLNLSRTGIEKIPRCFSGLKNLQSLDVSWCENLASLHSGINKHQSLLNLNVAGCSNLAWVPLGISKLVSLRILGQVVFKLRGNATNALQLRDLKELTLLQHLSIAFSGRSNCQDITVGIFGGMEDMRKLFFENYDEDYLVQLPEDMSGMRRLEILHLHNCVVPSWISQLHNLMLLLLKGDYSDSYQDLQTIPNLRRLILIQNKQCIDFPTDFGYPLSFPKLEALVIEDFCQLQRFPSLADNAMPMLQHFRLVNCRRLERIPQGLDRLNSLEKLQVIGCERCRNDLQENGHYGQIFKRRNVQVKCE
ncbi:hypothetical protein SUGI_0461680 [Cryptomeria japonica]|nr:hypothetical protein SUGI_0461680 [Cryptomeria japonica]